MSDAYNSWQPKDFKEASLYHAYLERGFEGAACRLGCVNVCAAAVIYLEDFERNCVVCVFFLRLVYFWGLTC